MAYGVQPTGFVRKGLPEILETRKAKNREVFGPGVIQEPQTPLGQVNGILSEFEAIVWEIVQEVYQSYDPDQAEGLRLEQLARIRLLERVVGETDAQFARAITNANVARIGWADFYRAVRALPGVRFVRIYSNDTDTVNADGLLPHSVTVAALGGSDEDIAQVARKFIVPGITSSGNVAVETIVDGFCRTINITRPVPVNIQLEVDVRKINDPHGCPPASNTAIAETIVGGLTGENHVANGVDITIHLIARTLSAVHPNVEVVSVRAARGLNPVGPLPLAIGFNEIAAIALTRVVISVVP